MKRQSIIRELSVAYAMELETVQNYIAASVNLDGVRSDVIKKALAADVPTELLHAQQLAARIKTIGGIVPGSLALPRGQKSLQPKKDTTDIVAVIKGVIAAEEAAIAQYTKIIRLCMEGILLLDAGTRTEHLGLKIEPASNHPTNLAVTQRLLAASHNRPSKAQHLEGHQRYFTITCLTTTILWCRKLLPVVAWRLRPTAPKKSCSIFKNLSKPLRN